MATLTLGPIGQIARAVADFPRAEAWYRDARLRVSHADLLREEHAHQDAQHALRCPGVSTKEPSGRPT